MHYGDLAPHIAEGLIQLRKRIDAAAIPPSQLDESLNVATWNIREFGRRERLDASIFYIAEIMNQFDLITLVELRDKLGDLKRVMDILGREWQVVFSDYMTDAGGNRERIAFLFDRRMVRFTGLAAEADAPRKKNKKTKEYETAYGWWRSPYMASFRAGNFDFVVMATHTRWADGEKDRIEPLRLLGDWVKKRTKDPAATDRDFVLMGDFNIPGFDSDAYAALTNNGKTLKIPEKLMTVTGTNLSKRNTYDQILHDPTDLDRFSDNGGVLDFYAGDWEALYRNVPERPTTEKAFTYELSDHLPLWLQINTEIMDQRLQLLANR